MKAIYWIVLTGLWSMVSLSGCDKAEDEILPDPPHEGAQTPDEGSGAEGLPEGYFEVNFSSGFSNGNSRAAVTGPDGRVRHLRYIIYKSTGEYVKEKVVLTASDPTANWPLAAVKDTLPKGNYIAVFTANVEKTFFPYATTGGTAYADVLTNYKTTLADGRIVLPNAEFADNSEYYWAKVSFSDAQSQPYVLLQRIISMFNLHRNFVDAQTALNQLVNNIVTQIGYKNIIRTTVQGVLPAPLRAALDLGPLNTLTYGAIGGLDAAVNLVVAGLVEPVTDALYNILLQRLVDQIGLALTGNANQAGTLAFLGALLNPWQTNDAHTAIVTLRNFPKTMDFSLTVKDYFTGDQRFRSTFTGQGSAYSEKDILIKGFNGIFDVRRINVIKQGLISGLLVDQVIDNSLLLNGTFIDVNDPIQATIPTNIRYQSDYSFVDLGLKSYTQQTDGNHSLSLSLKLSNIANLDGILGGIPIVGPLLGAAVRTLVGNITVTVPLNLPLLGVDNLSLSGGWSTPTAY